jgi:type II secretory pathway pseudopilin PulG
MPARASLRRQRGAALLILLAVVSMGAAWLFINASGSAGLRAERERRTLAAIAQAREALLGFANAHGRLPRPAVSATNGAESVAACSTDAACTGFLPWVALGIERADSWGKLLRYSVAPVYTEGPVARVSAVGTKTVLTRDTSGRIRYLAGSPVCTLASQCLAAVVYSAGRENFGTGELGVPLPNASATNIDEAANNIATLNFMSRARSEDPRAPGGEFDDLVAFVAPGQLYQQMEKAGMLP